MRVGFLTMLCLLVLSLAAAACTGVVIAREGEVIVGGNEDWERFDSFMWATAPTSRAYGVVYFGYEIRGEWGSSRPPFWYEFHGINDRGLYFDSFGAPCDFPERTMDYPRTSSLWIYAMEKCATVEEAVAMFERSNLEFMQCQQFFFADKHGNAAVVEGDHTIWMDGDTFAVTNFYHSTPMMGGFPCWRYSRVRAMMNGNATPSVDRVAELLEASSHGGTRYSLICDLVRGEITVSYARDFVHMATLSVAELVSTGRSRVSVESLVYGQD